MSCALTAARDLTVNGTTTTINTQTLAVEDPLIEMAKDNSANSVDIGFYGKYNDGTARYLGLFSDASNSNNFKLFKGTTVQPTTTVDIGGAGYSAASLTLDNLETLGYVDASLGVRVQSGQAIDFIDTNLGHNSIFRDTTNGGLQMIQQYKNIVRIRMCHQGH